MLSQQPKHRLNPSRSKWVGSAITAGASLVGGGISALTGKRNQQRAFEQQKELMRMQNEYNTPTAQKQRMLDAGMNPYGSASSPVPAAAGSAPPPAPPLDLGGMAALVSSIVQAVKNPSEIEKTKADTAKTEQDTSASKTAQSFTELQKQVLEQQSPILLQKLQADANKTIQETANLVKAGKLTDEQIKTAAVQRADLQASISLKEAQTRLSEQQQKNLAAELPKIAATVELLKLQGINTSMDTLLKAAQRDKTSWEAQVTKGMTHVQRAQYKHLQELIRKEKITNDNLSEFLETQISNMKSGTVKNYVESGTKMVDTAIDASNPLRYGPRPETRSTTRSADGLSEWTTILR